MLAALGEPLDVQAKYLAALRDTPAASQPLYLWLAAHHFYAADQDNNQIIALAERGARHHRRPPRRQDVTLFPGRWRIATSRLEYWRF